MKIVILTTGSRGDIQPFVALGLGLKNAGYQVSLCAPANFQEFISSFGLDYAYMHDELFKLTETTAGRAAIEGKGQALGLIKKVNALNWQMLQEEWAAVQGADALIYHPKALGGYHLAEKLDIPGLMSLPLPLYTPTREFPSPLLPDLGWGGWYNRLTYQTLPLLQAPFMGVVNRFRREVLALPARSRFASELHQGDRPVPVLYSYSPHLLPRPDDWPASAVITGYWFLDRQQDWQPSPALADFLAAGPPPVYVGFGSMAGQRPQRLAQIVTEALARAGQRGILATGWGGLAAADLPETIFMLDQAPHDWLFPRVAAVVHHGGAGTTAAGLRAGRPTVICPFLGDQPFWGRVVFQRGARPAPIPQKKLTAANLAEAIKTAATGQAMRQQAARLGEQIRAEDGVGRAVEVIEQYARGQRQVFPTQSAPASTQLPG